MSDKPDQSTEPLLPEGWEDLPEADKRELFATLSTRFDEARQGAKSVDDARQVRAIREAMTSLVGNIRADAEVAAELDEPAPELPEPVAETTEPEATEPETETEAETAEPEVAEVTEGLVKVAAADAVAGEPAAESTEEAVPEAKTAAAISAPGQTFYPQGETLDLKGMGAMLAAAMAEDRGEGGPLWRMDRFDPTIEMLGAGSASFHTRMIHDTPPSPRVAQLHEMGEMAMRGESTAGVEAKTAALCGPAEPLRNIPEAVTDSRAVRNVFRRLPAERGAFDFIRAIGLSDVTGAVSEWTDTDQDAVDENNRTTWKACLDIACQPVLTTALHRVYSCLGVEILTDYSAPETVANYVSTTSALHSRTAEGLLLEEIKEKSVNYTWNGNYGSFASLVAAIVHCVSTAEYSGRLETGRYVVLALEGFLQKIGIDTTNRGYCCVDDLRAELAKHGIGLELIKDVAKSDSAPAGFEAAIPAVGSANVSALDTDLVYGTGPLAANPNAETYPLNIITPDDGFFFELPSIDTGWATSPELARQNRKQLFTETFEGVEKHGASPWFHLAATVCHSGDRAGFNTVACNNAP